MMLGDQSDGWIQSFGYLTLLGLAAALWWGTQNSTATLPLLAGALVFFNPTTFYWGHSVRAYGLAALLAVLFFGAMWRLLESPTGRRLGLTIFVAILNVQASYQNAPLLLAISLGAVAVTAVRRHWIQCAFLLLPGFLAALSLLIHLPAILYVQKWNIMIRQKFGIAWVWERMSEALGSAGSLYVWLWVALVVGLGTLAVRCWLREGTPGFERVEVREVSYSFISIALATPIVFGFILHVGYPTQEWYYISFMCLVAAALDFGFSSWLRATPIRTGRIVLAVVIASGSLSTLWERAQVRRTNVDLVAAKVRAESTPRDLIIVRPFYCGMVFQHYYRGSTPWMTIPPIAWSELHNCYDSVKHYLEVNEPMGSTIERIATTLKAGGRVWFVGGIQFLQAGAKPPASPPAPHPQFGWSDEVYSTIWGLQVGYFVQNHATAAGVVPVPCDHPVQKFEDLQLVQVSGWRE